MWIKVVCCSQAKSVVRSSVSATLLLDGHFIVVCPCAQEEPEPEEEPEGEDLNEEEEEYDEEEEEDEEDEARRKRRKKARFGGFILDEAEVDDEVEDEEDWEEGAEDMIDPHRASEETSSKELNSHRRLQMMLTSQKEDEIEDYYRRKYADTTAAEGGYREADVELSDEIAQQTLLPGVKDPNLWMVKCKLGEEKATLLQMMRKFIAFQFTEEPLQIRSVVAPEGVKGYIYIEAYKHTHVKQVIQGVGNLRIGLYQQTMVPIKEMTDVLRVTREQAQLRPKQWVRLKRGIYRDDLAQVDYVDTAQSQVNLKLLPRVDYTRPRGALRSAANEPEKRKKSKRPAAKLFDVDAIRAVGGEVTTDGDFLIFEGNRYSRKGFLYKAFATSAIDPLDFQAHELKKYFKMGDHVKVISGRFEGDTGLIVRVEENMVVLFSDLTMHELKVLPRDLQLCADMATGVDSLGQFQWGDLVQLESTSKGTSGGVSTYNRTPMYGSGSQTPMYQSGSRTPMYGSQTPLYEAGSRTPHFGGGQTPLHDGSRTPVHGAWDPTASNTPARPELEDYNLDEGSPSPSYQPATPGYQAPETPQGPFTPQTPGMYGSDHSYSPSPTAYQPSPSPTGYVTTPSPVTFQAGTPSPSTYGGYSPTTPGAPSPFNPQTPGA
ncbi:hypothetical protein V5799_013689, partial [Amblyomma americanum]